MLPFHKNQIRRHLIMNKKMIYSVLVSTLLITLVTLFSSHLMVITSKKVETNVCTIENTDKPICIYSRKL